MKLRHVLPFTILFAWQVSPQRPVPRTRASLAFGYGLATLEDYTPAAYDCYGHETRPERSDQVEVETSGARLDVSQGSGRLTVFTGHTASSRADLAGTFGGFQLAAEGDPVGIGAGLTYGVPRAISSGSGVQLNAYLRLGSVERAHFRADYLPPTETFGAESYWKMGVEFDGRRAGKMSAFGGWGQTSYGSAIAFLELAVPATGNLDLLARGHWGPGHINPARGFAVGARLNYPR